MLRRGFQPTKGVLKGDQGLETLAHILDIVKQDLDPVLAPPHAVTEIRAAAAELSADLASFIGFETRLGTTDTDAEVDLAFNLSPAGLRRLADEPPAPSWSRLAELCCLWGERGDPPFSNAGELWVELDMSPDLEGFPAPNVFLAPTARLRRQLEADGPELDPDLDLARWILDRAVPVFLGRRLDPRIGDQILRCLDTSRGRWTKFQLGMMGARPVDALRLCLFGLKTEDLESILTALPWPGPTADLLSLARRLAPVVDHFGLHLDVGPRLYPSFGLEGLFNRSPWDYQPEDEPRWRDLLELLVQDGRATAAQRDALLAWPGESFDQALVFERALRRLAGREQVELEPGRVTRGLAYIKVARNLAGRDLTKAYFGAYHDGRHAAPRDAAASSSEIR